MTNQDTHVIVFHGTTSAFDKSIQEHGFQLKPELRPSHQMNVEEQHLCSFDGTYVALDRDTARYYAKSAVEKNGGEPRIYAFRVPLSVIVPDEDEVHFALTWNLANELGFDENSDDDVQLGTIPWSIDVAKRAVAAISQCFGMDEHQIGKAAAHLNAMIEPVIAVWDRDLYFFHPDSNDKGWSSPNWVRKLVSLDGGYELYREHMDQFVGCMRGASPETCPAGSEAFKGRVIVPFGFDGSHGVEIIGYGTIADPFEDYSNFDSYLGTELSLDPEFINEAKNSRQPALRFG
ncbi:hypothetical protein [Rhizobium sp. MHM7A]|uniref:hypothetical protein n=1 Tax=Rhizobium sp. MHM7A TaxID=2583233 RepID=UPI001106DC66|nr:hypothetical protein [Rhizobium sp. MHM7A]TLX16700.1 hypothetical protein FFR93_04985 [Rhizobium sp. MHM7A]